MPRLKAKTKGNPTLTASSTLAAQKLETFYSSFSGFKSLNTTLTLEHELAPDLTPVLKNIYKKLLKKDNLTRAKALNQLENEVIKDKDAYRTLLYRWPEFFNKFALDADRSIRLACFKVHSVLMEKSVKVKASFYKKIAVVWIVGRFDSAAEVADLALSCFERTFPQSKHAEAIRFVQDELSSYVLASVAPLVFEDHSADFVDAREVFGAIRVLALLTQSVEVLNKSLTTALITKKFWAFLKNEDAMIRLSMYEFVTTCVECSLKVLEVALPVASPAVLSSITEKRLQNISAMWNCVVSYSSKLPSCWAFVDYREEVAPCLHKALEDCPPATACAFYPFILPFLSSLPQALIASVDLVVFVLETICLSTQRSYDAQHLEAATLAYMEILKFYLPLHTEHVAQLEDHLLSIFFSSVQSPVRNDMFIAAWCSFILRAPSLSYSFCTTGAKFLLK
jgi:hypothetical protein